MPNKIIKSTLEICIFLFLFLAGSNSSNSQWVQQVSGTENNLLAVYFLNDNTGFLGSNPTHPLGVK
jgi:hypothetical protein